MRDPARPGDASVDAGPLRGVPAGVGSLDPSLFVDAAERSPDGFTLLESIRDASGRVIDFLRMYVNPAGATLIGRPREVLQGTRLLETTPWDAVGRELFAQYVAVVEGAAPIDREVHVPLGGGAPSAIRLNAVKVGDGLVATFTDVTARTEAEAALRRTIDERELAEEALRASDERFRLATEALHAIVYDIDYTTQRVVRTRGLRQVVGFDPDEVTSDSQWWLDRMQPDDLARIREEARAALARGATELRFDYRVRHRDGRWVHIEDRSIAIRDAQGTLVRQVGCCQDVTSLRDATAALREADRRKDEFLAMLAHELRNPLAPIQNAVEILKVVDRPAAQLDAMRDTIERQVRHLSQLVDDLLDVSRITQNKITLRLEPLEIMTVVARAVETSRPLIETRKHDLQVSIRGEPVRVGGDLTRLAQVLSNLLNNAAKYTDEGGHIRLEVAREGDEVTMTVTDDGVGIAPEVLPHVFDLFAQADRSLDRSQGGLGIGLTLVRRLTEMHGGRVEAASGGLGCGSEFRVRLPIVVEDAASSRPPAPDRRAPARTHRILVVDDSVDSAESLALLLELEGHQTRQAYSGPAALEAAAAFEPAIVLLDIGLPGMDGYEVARRLRERPGGAALWVIALTGYGRPEDRQRALAAGCQAHMTKPVMFSELETLIRSMGRD